MKYNQKLPAGVEKQLDKYIERIKKIKWFQVPDDFKTSKSDKQIKIALKAFGVEAKIEYRDLKTAKDWGAVRDAAWDAARDAAWNAAWNAVRDAAWGAARDAAWNAAWNAAWGAARDAAWNAAWGAVDVLALNCPDYAKKYPKGNFINLIPLWEMGLYPCGVVNGSFIVYIPKK